MKQSCRCHKWLFRIGAFAGAIFLYSIFAKADAATSSLGDLQVQQLKFNGFSKRFSSEQSLASKFVAHAGVGFTGTLLQPSILVFRSINNKIVSTLPYSFFLCARAFFIRTGLSPPH
ncbi:MAG: hypothetical protein H6623_08550 [Bdellovibrionaceae bacterium]|nr:hypothetical protein [Pseudobdellovibrionaceae bacterium]